MVSMTGFRSLRAAWSRHSCSYQSCRSWSAIRWLNRGHSNRASSCDTDRSAGCNRSRCSNPRCSIIQRRSRDIIRRQRSVNIDQNPLVARRVEAFTWRARGTVRPRASNFQIDALRIILSAVLCARRVQCNNLMAEHVVARLDRAGDRHSPAVVVGNQLVRRPGPRHIGVVDQARLIDLEEFERRLVDCGAVTVAFGQVVNHRAVVAVRPGGPLELDFAAGSNGRRECAWSAVLVADDVWLGVFAAVDEAQVGGRGGPSDDRWGVGLIGELVHDVAGITIILATSFLYA